MPLAVLFFGLWQQERGAADEAEFEAERLRLTRVVENLDARSPRDGRLDMSVRLGLNGQTFVGPLAVAKAREALGDVQTVAAVARYRRALPPVVAVSAGLAAGLSVLVLLAGVGLGQAGRRSRDALVGGFSLMRRILPAALALQVLLAATAFVAAVAFEGAALVQPGRISGGEMKLIGLALVAIAGSLWVAGSAVFGLRRTLAAFEPDPLSVIGRTVSREEAPGLWRLLDSLADRLGALRPDNVVIGLTEGFFVSSGPKVLEPGGSALVGRTLYLPLPSLALLRLDEVASIIGHELAHFAGNDTEYSLRFLPIYAGVERSLIAVATAGSGAGSGTPLLGPTLRLGIFVMEQFDLAVLHWSRRREFAADEAGAGLTSAEAATRALLRTAAIQPRVAQSLEAAAEAPQRAPPDLVAAILHDAITLGLDDPARHLEEEQPHPTDTHPPTRERIAALGQAPGPDLLAAASAPPPPEALLRLGAYLADPGALCLEASGDFLAVVRRNRTAFQERLEAAVAEVGAEERVLSEGTRAGAIFLFAAGGVFALAALGLAVFGLRGLSPREATIVSTFAIACGLALGGYGLFLLRRGERPFLVLRPEALVVPGLDRPIPWDDVPDLGMTLHHNRMVTRLLLLPEAPFPERLKGGRRVKLDAKRRIVTVTAVLPRGMKPAGFADLIGRYRQAAEARRLLAEHSGDAGTVR